MESLFQNCVSEFDLNFLDQTTNAKQVTPPIRHSIVTISLNKNTLLPCMCYHLEFHEQGSATAIYEETTQCSIARKLGVLRVKDRLINISQVIHKAKNTNQVLLEVQKDLLEKKQELEETRNLLFEKNEEHRVICDERSTYFNEASEYSKEVQKLKQQLKQFGEKDFDVKLKDQIIEGYSNQMKGLQTEMDNLMEAKKQSEKEASMALMRANKDKSSLEKKLIRLLKDYVPPMTQKSDKWLQSLIKKYLPHKDCNNSNNDLAEKATEKTYENVAMSPKEEDSQQIQKVSVETAITNRPKLNETTIDDVGLLTQSSMLYRNTSLDFEFIGSVDTGRGSSLAYSDGEKSSHSPDYYMTDSPCTVPNLCNRCNIPKSDVSTSPIPQETSDIGESSATDSCKTFWFISKSDACTSPIPSVSRDVAIDTADFIHEKCIHKKKSGASSCLENQHDVTNVTCDSNINQTSADINRINKQSNAADNYTAPNHNSIINKKMLTTPVKLQNNITSNTEEGVNSVSSIANPVKNLTIEFLADEAATKHINISSKESPTTLVKQLDKLTCNTQVSNDKTPIYFDDAAFNCSSIYSQELDTSKPTEDVMSNNEKVLNKTSSISGSVEDLTIISFSDDDDCVTNPNSIPSIEVPKTPTKLRNGTPGTDLKIYTLQEKECLKLNNSDNFSHDVGTDIEVQAILDKMRLPHRLVTPIPSTPPRGTVRSPILTFNSQKTIIDPKERPVDVGFIGQMNLFQTQIVEAMILFIVSLPKYFKVMPQLFINNEFNEDLLRNLLFSSTIRHISPNAQEHNTHIKSSNSMRGQLVNFNKELNATKVRNNMTNVDKGGASQVNMHQNMDLEDLDEVFNRDSGSNEIKRMCNSRKENRKNITMPKAELLDFIASRNVNINNEKQSNGSNTGQMEHDNIQDFISNNDIHIEYTNKAGVVNSNTSSMPSTKETRNNIVYESDGNISGDDAMQQGLQSEYVEQINNKEDEEMSQNKHKTRKIRKCTKLEKLRLKMAPKGKIRSEIKQPVKKTRFKPVPIIIPQSISKKKVTESDTAATLNKKSVYENAVKVFNTSKFPLSKESKVALEDCVLATQISPKKSAMNVVIEVDDTTSKEKETSNRMMNNKKKLLFESENVTEPAICIEKNRGKRKRSLYSDNDLSDDTETLDLQQNINNSIKTKTVGSQSVRSSLSNDKAVSEIFGTKCTNEVIVISDTNESTNEIDSYPAKRKRTSVTDCKIPHKEYNINKNAVKLPETSNYNKTSNQKDGDCKTTIKKRLNTSTRQSKDIEIDQTVLFPTIPQITKSPIKSIQSDLSESPVSQRILRSSCVKQNKENGFEKTPIVSHLNTKFSSEELHSKADQNRSQQYDNTSVLSSERTPKNTTKSIVKSSGSNQIESLQPTVLEPVYQKNHDSVISYEDLSLFQNEEDCDQFQKTKEDENVNVNTNNFLCRMIENHGIQKIKYFAKKVPVSKMNEISNKLETSISEIIVLPSELCRSAMKKLVVDIRSWDVKHFLLGLIEFLRNPQRKIELYKKISCPPAPPMTNKEQVLLYVVDELQNCQEYGNIVNKILLNIEYILFALNKKPEEFDAIESMSHFYAILCRSYHKISKLRLFIIDAMYCLQFKSIVLIKQCLDVWLFVLPLGHMGLAKAPLVVCLVYLLHFYKCEDKFNRIQDVRNILRRKYYYDMTDWNETKILELFKTAIIEVRDIPMERKMLRLALIILAKRNGPKWCQNNIIKKMLQPIIKDKSSSDVAKRFCVSLLGPLIKPYPNDMKVHCEMINDYLLEMLDKKNSTKMQEAIIVSLISANKHNNRLIRFLLKWHPKNVSREFEIIFRDYVRSKTVKAWKCVLSSSLS